MSDYGKILYELQIMRGQISTIDMTATTIDGWLPRKFVMKFFDIGDTTMVKYEKEGKLLVSKIGNRKFYCKNSISNLIKSNILNK